MSLEDEVATNTAALIRLTDVLEEIAGALQEIAQQSTQQAPGSTPVDTISEPTAGTLEKMVKKLTQDPPPKARTKKAAYVSPDIPPEAIPDSQDLENEEDLISTVEPQYTYDDVVTAFRKSALKYGRPHAVDILNRFGLKKLEPGVLAEEKFGAFINACKV